MILFNRAELTQLHGSHKGPCVSIYLPTLRSEDGKQQNPIRLKNLAKEAEEKLKEKELKSSEINELLDPVYKMIDDGMFWRYQKDGLALFLSPELFRYYRIPHSFKELVVVADRFHTKPLLPVISFDDHYYVLSLSKNEIRLWECTKNYISEVEMTGIPVALEDFWKRDDERVVQFHTRTSSYATGRAAVFYGHGEESDDREYIKKFFRTIDKGIKDILGKDQAPLVLAGVDHLLPIYRESNTYPYLLNDAVPGHPKSFSRDDLHEESWKIIEPHFKAEKEKAVQEYYQLEGTGMTSNNLEEIVLAAFDKRIKSLFVAVGVQVWGVVDKENRRVEIREEKEKPSGGDSDLLDLAAIFTIEGGGDVYAVEADEVPGNSTICAIYRF